MANNTEPVKEVQPFKILFMISPQVQFRRCISLAGAPSCPKISEGEHHHAGL